MNRIAEIIDSITAFLKRDNDRAEQSEMERGHPGDQIMDEDIDYPRQQAERVGTSNHDLTQDQRLDDPRHTYKHQLAYEAGYAAAKEDAAEMCEQMLPIPTAAVHLQLQRDTLVNAMSLIRSLPNKEPSRERASRNR